MRPASFVARTGRMAASVLRWIGVAVAAGAVLAALGPFGSYMNGSPMQLASYWIAAMLLGLALYGIAYRIVSTLMPADCRLWWPALIAVTLLVSVPEALATRMGAFWLWPALVKLRLPMPLWFAQTAAIGLAAMSSIHLIVRRLTSARQNYTAPLPSSQASTVSLGKDVLALQMEDHYVRVHRSNGSKLILMSLGRAIESVEADGLRTHRSWWVASHAVAAIEGNARSMRLFLSNGVVAPVARSAVAHLKAAGWIVDPEFKVSFQEARLPFPNDQECICNTPIA